MHILLYLAAIVAANLTIALYGPSVSIINAFLFIGGSTEWKLSQAATTLVKEAKQRGKWVHAGRVNGGARINHFWHLQADSFDGTGVAIAPQKEMSYLIPKLQALSMQLSFF